MFDYEGENDPDFDESKADRNNDGKISDWEKSVGNAVAKSMREQKEKKSAESNCEQELLQCREALSRIEHITEHRGYDLSDEAIRYIHNICETVLKDKRPAHTDIPNFDAESFEADNCEGKKLKDSGYCNLNFDWSSSGLTRSCQNCGNEEFMDDYWDSQRISISEPEEGKILCSMTEFNGGRDENDLGYCSFDFDYGSGEAFSECDVCGTEVYATFNNSFYDDDDDDDEFESEFSKGEMLNLKKYIDYPISWINKQVAPSNERKARKFEQKERGQIPTKREPEDFRQSIKTPTWFKAVQLGLIASVVGVMGLVDTKRTTDEEPEEPEEQKEE